MSYPIKLLKARQGRRSMRALAREIGCSAAYLSDVMTGKRGAGPKILGFLGLSRVTRYSRTDQPPAEQIAGTDQAA